MAVSDMNREIRELRGKLRDALAKIAELEEKHVVADVHTEAKTIVAKEGRKKLDEFKPLS
jgi:hypothetical protein